VYFVARIDTGKKVYSGRSLTAAANALMPGTCYGVGQTKEDAWSAAWSECVRFRRLSKKFENRDGEVGP
jgi:hypothetical protein